MIRIMLKPLWWLWCLGLILVAFPIVLIEAFDDEKGPDDFSS